MRVEKQLNIKALRFNGICKLQIMAPGRRMRMISNTKFEPLKKYHQPTYVCEALISWCRRGEVPD